MWKAESQHSKIKQKLKQKQKEILMKQLKSCEKEYARTQVTLPKVQI
jgi:hypothetical protein